MKKFQNGLKVQNWHRPPSESALKWRFVKERNSDPTAELEATEYLHTGADRLSHSRYVFDAHWDCYNPQRNDWYDYRDDEQRDESSIRCDDKYDYFVRQAMREIESPNLPWILGELIQDVQLLRNVHDVSREGQLESREQIHIELRLKAFLDSLPNFSLNNGELLVSAIHESIASKRELHALQSHARRYACRDEDLVLFSPFWIRQPSTWNGQGVFLGFLGHLFVTHETPHFLFDEWQHHEPGHRGYEPRLKWISWFILIAQGGSLKHASKLFEWRVAKKFSGDSTAGMLASVGEADYYAVNLDANQRYRFQLSSSSTTLYPRPGKTLSSEGRRISLYNEFAQWLESSYGDATAANYFFARPEVTGRHYLVVEALTDNGLGGYSLSMVNDTFGKERLNHVVYTDYSQHKQSNLNEIVSAGIRSIYAPFQTQITSQAPPAAQEHVEFELRPDANGSYCGGLGGGQYGNMSPAGSAWVGRGTTCGTWDSFSAIWFDGIMHELGHSIGIPHNYHPRTGATIFTVGSYLVNHNAAGYTTPVLQQERRYADWVLQSGAQESELEPNDSASIAQDLNEPLGWMKRIGDALDDQVVVSGRIGDKNDADWYAITMTSGQSLALDIDSAEHQLGLDSSITVFDSQGNELAIADNSLDRESQIASLDPFLIFTAATAGTYHVVVKGVGLSTAGYRLKVTPDTAIDKTAPRIFNVWPQPDQVVDETRQIVLWVDDLLDPATVDNQTFVLRGAAGVVSGKFTFDPLDSTVIFTADSKLTPGTYTLTIKSGANGVKDLWGNSLDGETIGGKLAFPAVSGNGTAGGDFVTQVVVGSVDTTPAAVRRLDIHPAETGIRDAANRLFFQMYFSDEMDIVSLYSADWQLRGSGADGKFDTADDQHQSLDVFVNKPSIGSYGISLYALGNVPPGSYRFEAQALDAVGHTVEIKTTTFLGGVVPATAFYQDAAFTQPGLKGSYFNENLAKAAAESDWRVTRTVSGTRTDSEIDFDTYGWGDRSVTGVTGGGSHWDNFSTQSDGYVNIPVDGVQLVTKSDDSSRLWVDLNRNGQFESSELANNHFGQAQALSVGDTTAKIPAGNYARKLCRSLLTQRELLRYRRRVVKRSGWEGTVEINHTEAIWKPARVPKAGYYMVELSGEKNGIAGTNGALLDGEYIDSHIPGGGVQQGDDFSPSGDSTLEELTALLSFWKNRASASHYLSSPYLRTVARLPPRSLATLPPRQL